MKLTTLELDEDNRMLRIGFGKNKGKWFSRIDLWFKGFRLTGKKVEEKEPTKEPSKEAQALKKLIENIERMPRRRIKDGQTFYYVDYDDVDAYIEEARKTIGEPHLFSRDYLNKVIHS